MSSSGGGGGGACAAAACPADRRPRPRPPRAYVRFRCAADQTGRGGRLMALHLPYASHSPQLQLRMHSTAFTDVRGLSPPARHTEQRAAAQPAAAVGHWRVAALPLPPCFTSSAYRRVAALERHSHRDRAWVAADRCPDRRPLLCARAADLHDLLTLADGDAQVVVSAVVPAGLHGEVSALATAACRRTRVRMARRPGRPAQSACMQAPQRMHAAQAARSRDTRRADELVADGELAAGKEGGHLQARRSVRQAQWRKQRSCTRMHTCPARPLALQEAVAANAKQTPHVLSALPPGTIST